jgi:hypothetical protein
MISIFLSKMNFNHNSNSNIYSCNFFPQIFNFYNRISNVVKKKLFLKYHIATPGFHNYIFFVNMIKHSIIKNK